MCQISIFTFPIKVVPKSYVRECKRFKRFWHFRPHFENYVKSTNRKLSTIITIFQFLRISVWSWRTIRNNPKPLLHFYSPEDVRKPLLEWNWICFRWHHKQIIPGLCNMQWKHHTTLAVVNLSSILHYFRYNNNKLGSKCWLFSSYVDPLR